MVTKQTIRTIFKLRRALEIEWEQVNPILQLGEPGYAYDIERLKIGNGQDHWNQLDYIDINQDELLDLVKSLKVEDLADGMDYATKEYVNESIENIIIDCGTSTIGV